MPFINYVLKIELIFTTGILTDLSHTKVAMK